MFVNVFVIFFVVRYIYGFFVMSLLFMRNDICFLCMFYVLIYMVCYEGLVMFEVIG